MLSVLPRLQNSDASLALRQVETLKKAVVASF